MRRLNARVLSVALLAAVALAGCASMRGGHHTEMQIADAAAMTRARTFMVQSEAHAVTGVPSDLDKRIRAAIEATIRSTLEAKGYRESATGADLKVSYHGVSMLRERKADAPPPVPVAHTPVGPGDPFAAYEPLPESRDVESVGMLLILVVDTHTDAPVWQGTTERVISSPNEAVGAAERATARLLADVPKVAAP